MSDYQTLVLEIEGGVALIRLNRPDALNALNSQLMGELSLCIEALDRDEAVRCLVLTGPEKAFAASADIKEMASKSYAEMFREDFFTEAALRPRRAASSARPWEAALVPPTPTRTKFQSSKGSWLRRPSTRPRRPDPTAASLLV